MSQWDEVFSNLRRGPWADDPNGIPQERMQADGQAESSGWLADNSVTSDVIRANAVIAAKISAGAIETDKLAANAVTAAKIAADTITANEIAANAITTSELSAGAVTAAKIAANTITANEIAADTITASQIAANAITASEIAADAVTTTKILAANVTSSRMEVTISGKTFGANSGSAAAPGYYFDSASNYGFFYQDNISPVPDWLSMAVAGSRVMHLLPGGLSIAGLVDPGNDNTYALGSSGLRWTEVWAVNGTINTSDERLKRDIADAPLGLDFVKSLRPRVYRWRDAPADLPVLAPDPALDDEKRENVAVIERIRKLQLSGRISDAEGNAIVEVARSRLNELREEKARPILEAQKKRRPGRRLHYGLIAQEVKSALDAAGVDPMDAAFWREDSNGEQALNYAELTIPLLRAVQELAARVEALESQT